MVSIDTRFADQYYYGTSDFMVRLPSTMRNVMRIALSSIELPEVAYVFSAKNGNTCFSVNGVNVSITESSYMAPTSMVTVINAAITAAAVTGVTCGYDATANRFFFSKNAGGAPATISLTSLTNSPCSAACAESVAQNERYWGIGYNLGFRDKEIKVPASGSTYATQPPQVTSPAYYLVQVRCPDMMESTLHRTGQGSFVQALAKVVLRNGAYVLNYDDMGNMLRKENTFRSPTSISQLRVSLVDAYGRLVEMGDIDWSMTFEMMEVISSCQYNELNQAGSGMRC
jgi:hypothetical protein